VPLIWRAFGAVPNYASRARSAENGEFDRDARELLPVERWKQQAIVEKWAAQDHAGTLAPDYDVITNIVQRWTLGREHRRPAGELIRPAAYDVAPIASSAIARGFVATRRDPSIRGNRE
jgi:hypothetical protein